MFAKAFLMCISAMALALIVISIPRLREESSLFAATGTYLLGTTLFPVWLFQGLEKMKFAVGTLGIARLLTAGALVCFVRHPGDYVTAGAIQASVELIASLFAAPLLFRHFAISWYRPSFADVASCLGQAWPAFLSNSSLFLSFSSTTVILGLVATKTEVGYYSAADKLVKASIAILSPISQALYSHIAAEKCRSSFSALQMIRRSVAPMLILSLSLSVATGILARPFCRLLLGDSFAHSAMVLECLSPLPLLFASVAVFGTQTMLIFDMEMALTKAVSVATVSTIPITVLLSIYWGAVGAALSSVILAALVVAGMLVALQIKGLPVWKDCGTAHLPLVFVPPMKME